MPSLIPPGIMLRISKKNPRFFAGILAVIAPGISAGVSQEISRGIPLEIPLNY